MSNCSEADRTMDSRDRMAIRHAGARTRENMCGDSRERLSNPLRMQLRDGMANNSTEYEINDVNNSGVGVYSKKVENMDMYRAAVNSAIKNRDRMQGYRFNYFD